MSRLREPVSMNILFVCTRNRLRSPTAQSVFASHPEVTALSAGTNRDADTPVSGDLIEWAEVVVAMETVTNGSSCSPCPTTSSIWTPDSWRS